jgi:DNA-binding NarL/FixJ family response regulator
LTDAVPSKSATRILIVDDDDGFRRTTARILTDHGYSCLEASSSVEARAVLDEEPDVAVALCDVNMPDTSGMELLAGFAADFPDLAVVMMTAIDDPHLAEEAFALGAFGYVIKPFGANELLVNLSCAVRRRDLELARRLHVRELEATLAHRAAYLPEPRSDDASEGVRVLIVDDHAIFTHSLVRLLGTMPELTVVGTADSVATALDATLAFKPDVVLMDFGLPDGDGAHATEQIKALMPSIHVIMLTARTDDQALVRAIAAGCSGFVQKADAVEDLREAIIAAHLGELTTTPNEISPLLRQLPPTHRGLGADLTPRELEVLELMVSGLINKQVARQLGLQLNTVRNHSQNILYKLKAHSRLEAIAIAVRDGVIAFPSYPADR